jgi:hypothetical protein
MKGEFMDLLKLIPFLGHSSIYEPFDIFLSQNNVVKRPKIGKNLELDVFVDKEGLMLTFEFETAARDQNIQIKSAGNFIFKLIYITLIPENPKLGKYQGTLPFGLNANDSRLEVEKKMGSPKRKNDESDNYFSDGLVVTSEFESDKFQFLRLELPRDGLRKHGLCP